MKRRLITIALLLAVVLTTALCAWASWINYPNIQGAIWEAWSGDYGSGIKNEDSNFYFWTKSGGKISLYETPSITAGNRILEASGSAITLDKPLIANGDATLGDSSSDSLVIKASTKVTDFSRPATVINSYSQLSSWGAPQAAVNGVSYYPLEPGRVYEVDLAALAHSQTGYNCSGVTLVLWDASSGNNQKPTEISIIPPLGSYLASEISGTTYVYIFPYPGAGATTYGSLASKPQSLQSEHQYSGVSCIITGSIASGASIAVLNRIGESVTMETRNNSAVSAWLKNATLKWSL